MFQRFAAALLPAGVLLLGALQVMLADDQLSPTEGGQLLALVAGLAGTFGLKLLPDGHAWRGALKTGSAVLAAVATLVIPLFTGFTTNALIVFLLALLQALAAEIGVQMRTVAESAGRHVLAASPAYSAGAPTASWPSGIELDGYTTPTSGTPPPA